MESVKMKTASIIAALLIGSVVFGCKPVDTPRSDDFRHNEIRLELLNWTAFREKLDVKSDEKFKLTLVDAWATFCVPCRKNFHHTVELHEKYGPKGLQVISLSLDDRNDMKTRDAALRFLTEQKADFTNVLLDEESDVGFANLDISGIPALFLYDSSGREIERFTGDDPNKPFTYEQIERAIAERLD